MPFDPSLIEHVMSSERYRYFPEITEDDPLFYNEKIKSFLIMPLMAGSTPIGTLNLGSFKENGFTLQEIDLVERYIPLITITIENANLYERLHNLFMNTVASLSSAIDTKSSWTQDHSRRVAYYAGIIARRLGLSKDLIKDIELASLLHDIGKIGIEDAILNKPFPLSEKEVEMIKEHPLKGAAILEPIEEFRRIISIIRHHHERWDGKGYPDGLSGEEIPLGSRILHVADAFEAMTAGRPYKKGLTLDKAMEELERLAGIQFDPRVVKALVCFLSEVQVFSSSGRKSFPQKA